MKKLLIILFTTIFGFNSVFANTDLENFVFDQMYNEYAECTVYYKFLSRGISLIKKNENRDLTDFEKKELKATIELSELNEKNLFIFAKKLNVPNEEVQKNIERYYKSMLAMVNKDYSKSNILNRLYKNNCAKITFSKHSDRIAFWESKFDQSSTNSIKGTILTCVNPRSGYQPVVTGIEFISSDKAIVYNIKDFKLTIATYQIRGKTDKIDFTIGSAGLSKVKKNLIPRWFYLHRDRLTMYFKYSIDTYEDNVRKRQCEINKVNLESFMNESLQTIISKQKKSNKI